MKKNRSSLSGISTRKRTLKEKHSDILGQLYLQNRELAIRNKILSLLAKLYRVTLSSLDRKILSQQMIDEMRASLHFECIALFVFEGKNTFNPLAFSLPDKLKYLARKLYQREFHVSKGSVLEQALHHEKAKEIPSLVDVWKSDVLSKFFSLVEKKLTIRSSLIFPLNADRTIGFLTVCSNRPFKDSSQFEKEARENIVNVITIALNKVLIYNQLQQHIKKIRELYEMRSSFLTVASHQLRTPVSIIRGMLSLMNEKDMSTKEKLDMIPKALQAANNLEHIIHDILTATEIDFSKLSIEIKPTNIAPIIDEIVSMLKLKAEQKGIAFHHEKTSLPLPTVLTESTKIREAIFNIVDNAINYTEWGSVTVSLQNMRRRGKKYLAVVVKDTGIGMTAEDRRKLGEKFYRSKHALSIQPNGTGLGFFITRGVMRASRGILEFESEGSGKGSIFRMLLLIAEKERG